jgi:hybrid cluster-associated redox disulfide protein
LTNHAAVGFSKISFKTPVKFMLRMFGLNLFRKKEESEKETSPSSFSSSDATDEHRTTVEHDTPAEQIAAPSATPPIAGPPTQDSPKPVSTKQHITKDMFLGEVVRQHPKAAFVFMQYGLHCVGCYISEFETVEQGALGHGMPPEMVDEMIADANLFIDEESQIEEEGRTAEARTLPAAKEQRL